MPQPTVPAKRPVDDSDDPDYTSEDFSDPKPHTRRKTRQRLPANKTKPNMIIDRHLDTRESDSTSEIDVDSDPDAGDITADGEITPYTPRRRMRRSGLYRRTSMQSPSKHSTAAATQGPIDRGVSDAVRPEANENIDRCVPPAPPAKQSERLHNSSKGLMKLRSRPSNPGPSIPSAQRQSCPLVLKLPMPEPRKGRSQVATHSPAVQTQPDRSMAEETVNRLNAIRRKWDSSVGPSSNRTISVEIPPLSRTQPDSASASDTSTSSTEDSPAVSSSLTGTTEPIIHQRHGQESITAASEPAERGDDYAQPPTPETGAGNTISKSTTPTASAVGAVEPGTETDDVAAGYRCPDPAAEPNRYRFYSELRSRLAREAARHSGSLAERAQLLARNTCIAQISADSYAAQAGALAVEIKGLEARRKDEIADFTRHIDDLNKMVDRYECQIEKLKRDAVDPRTIHELKATLEKRDEELRVQNARAEALLQGVTERDIHISDLEQGIETLSRQVKERDNRIEEFKSLTGSMDLNQMVEMVSKIQKWGVVDNSNTSAS
ncbi:hypothetical protein ASPVEDRAFT_86417 [Aspergillus versicolor CBS 583.65]|uniref:Uncharacterized protein n=1 Tax=Aspergillus versicolor CBS 583.65 TaxID=1036611 RepID=A0A1L9PUF8_ASPVE|nr:uncharacterized protein ASPVEDRAFT_86417 [Aspergillus versicolor CBS 583.65]OJJ05055.1 hypothetical protein ASPVEDRAFT_86417 [Aspergillus versicolor CBS 583.65]